MADLGMAKKSDLKVETEALICAAQQQALRAKYVKYNIGKTKDSPMCILCGKKVETFFEKGSAAADRKMSSFTCHRMQIFLKQCQRPNIIYLQEP